MAGAYFWLRQRHSDDRGRPPTAPSGLTATAASSSQINLSWTNNATNQTGFQIDQATSSDFTQDLTTVTVGAERDHLQPPRVCRATPPTTIAYGPPTRRRFCQYFHGERHDHLLGTPVAIPVPDGNFARIHLPTTLTR